MIFISLQQLLKLISMCEFEPFNPFSIYQQSSVQQSFDDSASLNLTEESTSMEIEDETQIEDRSFQTQTTPSRMKSNSSEFHNMTKQMVITMKQIMRKSMKDFGSTTAIRTIINQVWEKLTKKSHPTKQTLKVMFDSKVNTKILKKEGLIETEDQYDYEDLELAMEQLKFEILLRLKDSSIRSNLIDRRIAKKDVLLAYIQHFLHEELQAGDIKARFGSIGASKIKTLLNKSKRQEDFISDFLI